MSDKQPKAPLPRGRDTDMLGWLTSVGTAGAGYTPPPTVERLFLRLRIFWFFLTAIPSVVGAYLMATIAAGLASLVIGGPARTGAPSVAVGIVVFVIGLVIFIWLFALWFNRLTRAYRAKLEARAAAPTISAGKAPTPSGKVLDHVSLRELDARIAPPATSSEDSPQ